MNLKTKYLEFELKSPIIPSASPLSEKLENIKIMEDNGAAAVVLFSLFQEQVELEQKELHNSISDTLHISAEASHYFPEPFEYKLTKDKYLEHIRKAKESVSIPIIASLNATSLGAWIEYAKNIKEAGADALELNLYRIPTQLSLGAETIEKEYLDIIMTIKNLVQIPLAVKISPYFTNLANMALKIAEAGADALVLFNRFMQPTIDLDNLELDTHIALSHSGVSREAMRWIAILKKKIPVYFAATSGIHTGLDIAKLILVGADVTQTASALIKNGITHIKSMENELIKWMEEKEYQSIEQMKGAMSQFNIPNPSAFERAHYIKALLSYKI